MEAVRSLSTYLSSLNPAQRADIVATHPAVLRAPLPQSVHQVAVRLLGSVRPRPDGLRQDELQLMEAAVALARASSRPAGPTSCRRVDLEALVGVGAGVPAARVEDVLTRLAARGLAWPDSDSVKLHPQALEVFHSPGRRTGSGQQPLRRAPFLPDVPTPATTVLPTSGTRASAAAAEALQRVDQLLDAFGTPWPALKKGGISVAEVRRLARLLHCQADDEARLWLCLAAELELIGERHGRWRTTAAGARWPSADPARRLVDLVRALGGLSTLPLLPAPGGETTRTQVPPVLSPGDILDGAPAVRRLLLAVLRDLPEGTGAVPDDQLGAAVYYRSPTLFSRLGDPTPLSRLGASLFASTSYWFTSTLDVQAATTAALREGELLGLIADGALTNLGRQTLGRASTADQLAAANELLPLQERATVLADHAVIVPGVPTAELAAVLRRTAELERHDALTRTYRISPASVRRFFDDQPTADAEALLTQLQAISATPLPQTITYLVRDTARRHGHIRVTAARCVLDVRDEGLAAELTHRRDLEDLGLRLVGPTVLTSTVALDTVLDRLRAGGYAPADGTRASDDQEEVAQPPAPDVPSPRTATNRRSSGPEDVRAWAASLPVEADVPLDAAASLVRKAAPFLGAIDCATVADALGAGTALYLEYGFPANRESHRLILREPKLMSGGQLTGNTAAADRWLLPLNLNRLLIAQRARRR